VEPLCGIKNEIFSNLSAVLYLTTPRKKGQFKKKKN
jgi:hypothetical protein